MNNKSPVSLKRYLLREKRLFILITITGLIYNGGLALAPYLEGQMAQCLYDIAMGKRFFRDMLLLAVFYALAILVVQGMRAGKRLFVRKLANHLSRSMRKVFYHNLLSHEKDLRKDGAGSLMTRAVGDVDACVEGIRKFTTEIFDTGVVMVAYTVLLISYDWKLTIISCLFIPVSYFAAGMLKSVVADASMKYKDSASRLHSSTVDRVSHALVYRLSGVEKMREASYEKNLSDYEKKAVRSGWLESSLAPLYEMVTMAGVLPVIILGSRNVMGTGTEAWNIAAFTAFLSCFTQLAVKASHAAKLFNAVQKARVSWDRIKRFLVEEENPEEGDESPSLAVSLSMEKVNISWPDGKEVLHNVSVSALPGEIIGITGPVASGKSAIGKLFIGETEYSGHISLGGKELSSISDTERSRLVAYMGHEPMLMSDTVEDNVSLGDKVDVVKYLREAAIYDEILVLPKGLETVAGSLGGELSGGQRQRIALARTLAHAKPLMILDDPFSSVDKGTEDVLMENLEKYRKDRIILLISHRLRHFPEMSKVMYVDNGTVVTGTHEELMKYSEGYRNLVNKEGGEGHER